jgi:hypothetical protein
MLSNNGTLYHKHPDDGQKVTETCRCKILRRNINYLCILLVLFNNYSIMHDIEHIKLVCSFIQLLNPV